MDEEREDEAIIPEEDFREAIAACCEDPQLKRYFRLAPPGAKLFIGLGFYSTHFGDRVDPRQDLRGSKSTQYLPLSLAFSPLLALCPRTCNCLGRSEGNMRPGQSQSFTEGVRK